MGTLKLPAVLLCRDSWLQRPNCPNMVVENVLIVADLGASLEILKPRIVATVLRRTPIPVTICINTS